MVEGILLPDNLQWFQFNSITNINISLEWCPFKCKIINIPLHFQIIRKTSVLHGPIGINFKPKRDLPLMVVFQSRDEIYFGNQSFIISIFNFVVIQK
jgi:hypothetical protein